MSISGDTTTTSIHILHVDDDPDFLDITAEFLQRLDERFTIETATSPEDGLAYLTDNDVDCVVSDYEMPHLDGLEFLERVRETHPNLPFILFTGKGSEAVASDAISAGVTNYIQKSGGTEQYELLAKNVSDAVEKQRAQAQRDRWIEAVRTANEGIAIVDADGRYVDMNEAYAEHYGVEPTELAGEPWTTTVPEAEADRLATDVFPELGETAKWSGEAVGKRIDGTEYPKTLSLSTLDDGGHVCVIRDISTLTGREKQLRRQSAKLDVLFENSPDMILIHDPDGKLVDVNQNFCEKLGYSKDELLGKYVWDFDQTVDPNGSRSLWREMSVGDIRKVEGVFQRKDGMTFPAQIHLARVRIDGADRFFVICRDISAQKAYEQRLERKNERLEEFANIVSHDLRNPLSVAEGHLELERQDRESEHLDTIDRSLSRMRQLIDDILMFARQGRSVDEVESLSLDRLAHGCWETVATSTASLECETGLSVDGDESRVKQLLENVFRNAVDHGGDDVQLTVGTLEHEDGFYIADDGPGISPDKRDKIFESGYSTAESGTGFGLAIVREIVEAHDWSVHVTDSDTGGARFEIVTDGQ